MTSRPLKGLLPYYLPPGKFSGVSWYEALDGRNKWFYHRQQNVYVPKIRPRELISSVDEDLKPLVRTIHMRGGTTGPSCAGHVVSAQRHHRVRRTMRDHARKVRSRGLHVRDVETGEVCLWRDKAYSVDMGLLKASLDNEQVFELIGYLPVKAGQGLSNRLIAAVQSEPCAWVESQNGYLVVWVSTLTARDQRAVWRRISRGMI